VRVRSLFLQVSRFLTPDTLLLQAAAAAVPVWVAAAVLVVFLTGQQR
jgi:hypothetical protein